MPSHDSLSGKAWDRTAEAALRPSSGFLGGAQARAAERTRLRDVPYPGVDGRGEFRYLFDFGDEWRFRVKLVRVTPTLTLGERHPRFVASHGEAPPPYADPDDE